MTRAVVLAIAVACSACARDVPLPARGERWDQVAGWAAPTVEPGDPALLEHALALLEPHRAGLEDTLRQPTGDAVVRLDPSAFDPQVAEALDAFVAWYEGRDGVRIAPCGPDFSQSTKALLPMFQLARIALAAAPDDPSHPYVGAVLYLGHRLRAEGTTLLAAMIGASIADNAVRWAQARDLAPSQAFREWAPAPEFPRRAFAAEAVCSVALVEILRDTDMDPEQLMQDVGALVPGVSASKSEIARQVEQVRLLQEGNVHLIAALWNAPDALTAHLDARHLAASAAWSPPLVRLVTAPTPRMAANLRDILDRYANFIRSRIQ